jgi:hypothetical protein
MNNTELRTPENDKLFTAALARYNAHYNNDLYCKATAGKTSKYGCDLQDHALFYCGSPYHKPLARVSAAGLKFLDLFIPCVADWAGKVTITDKPARFERGSARVDYGFILFLFFILAILLFVAIDFLPVAARVPSMDIPAANFEAFNNLFHLWS